MSDDKVMRVELFYPRVEDSEFDTVEIELIDVRAADSIRVRYDFERNGWAILQASIFEWSTDDEECDEGWTEVAFTPAFALQKDEEEE
jgi:hypothetical protein